MTDVSTVPVLKSSSEKISLYNVVVDESNSRDGPRGVGGELLGPGFAWYVPLTSQNLHPIIIYSVANYRPILVTFGQMSL